MKDAPEVTIPAILLFAATGLAMGAIIGLLSTTSWLGIGLIIVIFLLILAANTEIDLVSDLALAIVSWVWRMIASAGQQWAGTDPSQPVPLGLRLSFAVGFAAGLALMIQFGNPAEAAQA